MSKRKHMRRSSKSTVSAQTRRQTTAANNKRLDAQSQHEGKTDEAKIDQIIETGVKAVIGIVVAGIVAAIDLTFLPIFRESDKAFVHIFVALAVLLVFLAIWFAKNLTYRLVIAFSTVVILGLALAFRSVFIEQRTVYFIIDASEGMRGQIVNVNPILYINTQTVPRRADIGLILVGSGLQGNRGCTDFIEIEPAPREENVPLVQEVSSHLESVPLNGYGNLQGAVLYALEHLVGRRGPHQIIIITSQVDDRCGQLDRAAVDHIIEASHMMVEIILVPVGEVSEEDLGQLNAFANRVIVAVDPVSVPGIVQEILTAPTFPYGHYYGLDNGSGGQ